MQKNLRNRIIAGTVGAALLLGPTAAFATATPSPVASNAPTKVKMSAADQAAHKAAVAAYRAQRIKLPIRPQLPLTVWP